MLTLFLLPAISGIIGAALRGILEKEHAKRDVIFSIFIGIVLGIFSFFFYDSLFYIPSEIIHYFAIFFFFFMFGWVIGDLLDTFIFIAKRFKK